VQVVGYESGEGFTVASGGAVEFVEATAGTELAFASGDDRRCAGTVHNGEHIACDAADTPYCDAHGASGSAPAVRGRV